MPRGDENGKIFVGGLSYETTKEGLETYFSKFGSIGDCVIMKAKDQDDPRIERSRGFGFVTFHDPSCVQKVIDSRPHYLDNKEIDPKPAVPRTPGSLPMPIPRTTGSRSFKIFIGGVAQGTSEEDLKVFFQSFGPVADVSLMKDVRTGRMRGFGFVGFHTEEPVTKICAIRFHQINGKTVEAKKAEPRDSRSLSVIGSNGGGMNRAMAPIQSPYAQSYGMGGYGGAADARAVYGAGYGGQPAQANSYGIPGSSVPASQYSQYVSAGAVSAIPASYADRNVGVLSQDPTAAQAYGAYGTSMTGYATGAGASVTGYGPGPGRYSELQGMPQSLSSQSPAGHPIKTETVAADFGSSYGAYGLGSYPQEASQYGPTRGGLSDPGYIGGAASANAISTTHYGGGAATNGGGDLAGYPANMYDTRAGASRGYHPYGR